MSGGWPAPVLVALLAAVLLGSSSVAQRRGMPAARGAGLGAAVLRSPWWWAGTLAALGGVVLQVVALRLGPLALVQTVLVVSVAVTTVAERVVLGRRTGRAGAVAVVLVAGGLAGLLRALEPTSARAALPAPGTVAALGVAGLAVLGLAALRARRTGDGALSLAVATGLAYGATAVALKTAAPLLGGGWAALAHPAPWVALALGPAAVVTSQHALHRSHRVTTTVAVLVVLDLLVGLAAGVALFGESLATRPAALLAAAACGALVVVGLRTLPAPAEGAGGVDLPVSGGSGAPAPRPSRPARAPRSPGRPRRDAARPGSAGPSPR